MKKFMMFVVAALAAVTAFGEKIVFSGLQLGTCWSSSADCEARAAK